MPRFGIPAGEWGILRDAEIIPIAQSQDHEFAAILTGRVYDSLPTEDQERAVQWLEADRESCEGYVRSNVRDAEKAAELSRLSLEEVRVAAMQLCMAQASPDVRSHVVESAVQTQFHRLVRGLADRLSEDLHAGTQPGPG